MALDANIRGVTTGTGAEVAGTNQLKIIPETDATTNAANVGGVRIFGEYDQGLITGSASIYSPEVDADYRTRVAQDLMYDDVVFNTGAQETGKHLLTNSVFGAGIFGAGQLTTNPTNITTSGAYQSLATYAYFPVMGTQTLSGDFELGFSAQPQTNSIIEFGFFAGGSGIATLAPTDGAFFRLTSAGLQGVASNNGTETSISFPLSNGTGVWSYTNNKKYQFIIYLESIAVDFWVNDGTGAKLLGSIPLPAGQGRMVASPSLPLVIRHRSPSTAGGAISALVGSYSVRVGGSNLTTVPSIQGNRIFGSYQGLAGATAGSLANYANSANPTAAVPTNTTAALGTGLGGQFWETVSLAVNTDGIICSYQNPAASLTTTPKRLVIRGISLASYVQTVIVGGPYIAQFSLAFGHTAVSLATTETATTKAPRRIALPFNQLVTAAQAVSTLVAQSTYNLDLGDAPIYVNPGEFVQLVTKHVGTVGTSGTVAHLVTFIYGFE
jgi:hypothetical protein